jgi:hypothetical protein
MRKLFLAFGVAALVASCGTKESSDAAETAQGAVEDATEQVEEGTEAAQEVAGQAAQTVEEGTEAAGTTVAEAAEAVKNAAEDVKETASKNWDSILSEYNSLADQAVETYKKTKSGDLSAVKNLPSIVSKAKSLGSQLEGAKSQLSDSQKALLAQAQQKLASIGK